MQKPTLQRYFYDNFFLPVSRELKPQGATVDEILEVAHDRAPFQVKISRSTLYQFLGQRDRDIAQA